MTKSSGAVTGDDLEELIAQNGGLGPWISDLDNADVDRYLFARFEGADEIGTCDAKGKAHEGVHTRVEKCGESFTPDIGNMYMSRAGLGGHDTDVETIASWLEIPRTLVGAVLLLSEPGTGKTALLEAAVTHSEREMTTVLCTPDHTKDSLFLRYMGDGHGDPGRDGEPSPYTLGPVPYAAKHGHVLYMDEFMLLVDGVKPILYSLADGRRFLPEGNVDGSPLEIHPDFRLVLSSNPQVRGASLPEPLASRCASTTLTVETSKSMLVDLGIDEDVIKAWDALRMSNLFRPQIRELRLADYWLKQGNTDQAASAFLPEHCPETMRKDVRDIVTSFIGGDLREDGRLVVA